MIKLYSSELVRRQRRDEVGAISELPQSWLVRARDVHGVDVELTYDHDPTDDEILDDLGPMPVDLERSTGAGRTRDELEPGLRRWSDMIAGIEAARTIAVRDSRSAGVINAIDAVAVVVLDRWIAAATKYRDAT